MLRTVHPLGLEARHTYDELVRYIETDPTKIKFPSRTASYRRNHPFLTQDDGGKAALGEQKRVLEYRMGDERGAYQPERPQFETPSPADTFYDPTEELQDMFARSQPLPMAPSRAPDTDQNALVAEGLAPPQAPSALSQMTSRVGENATQGALNAVSQYSQDTAAAALGWMGRSITEAARSGADFYVNELPAIIRQRAFIPDLDPDRFLAPRPGMWDLPVPQGIPRSILDEPLVRNTPERMALMDARVALRNAERLAIQDAPRVIGAAAEASVGAGLIEGAEMGAMAGVEAGPLGILAGGLGGAALAGGGMMFGGSLFHDAALGRSARSVASESLAHGAGMQHQPFQSFETINGMNHAPPIDRGGARVTRPVHVNIGTPPQTRHPSIGPDPTSSSSSSNRTPPPQSSYNALRDQVAVPGAASKAKAAPSIPGARSKSRAAPPIAGAHAKSLAAPPVGARSKARAAPGPRSVSHRGPG
jgi:hypothetical protein